MRADKRARRLAEREEWLRRHRGSGQAVKGGAGHNPAGCFHPGQPGNDAPTQHGSPGEQLAGHVGAGRPHTPPDLHVHTGMSDSSRGSQPPLEKSDICPDAVVIPYRQPDGRLLFKRVPCKTRGCEACGPRLRAKWAAQWAHAMAGEAVYRQVVDEGEPARMRRRKAYRGKELAHIPLPNGMRAVYSTAPVGELVADKIGTLASDFAALPNDRGRNASISGCKGTDKRARTGWLGVIADLEEEEAAKREPLGERLGRLRRSLEHVEIVARTMGFFIGRAGPDGLVVADPGDQAPEFWARVGLVPRRRRAVAA